MDNQQMVKRVTDLVADIESIQADAEQHKKNFESEVGMTYAALQDYLHSKKMKTIGELVDDAIKELSPQEQARIRQRMEALTPKGGFEGLIESLLAPSEVAKFIAYGYLIGSGRTIAAPWYFRAKSWWINYRTRAAARVLANGAGAGRVVIPAGALEEGLQKLTSAQRQEFLKGVQAEQAELQASIQEFELLQKAVANAPGGNFGLIEAGEKAKYAEAWGVETASLEAELANVAKLEKGIANFSENEAKIVSATNKINKWTKITLGAAVLAIVAISAWEWYQQHKIAEELREAIKKTCTARLYALYAERLEITQTDQAGTIRLLAAAYKQNKPQLIEFMKEQFVEGVKAGEDSLAKRKETPEEEAKRKEEEAKMTEEQLANAHKAAIELSCYNELAGRDERRGKEYTREDPDLDEMRRRHAKEPAVPAGQT